MFRSIGGFVLMTFSPQGGAFAAFFFLAILFFAASASAQDADEIAGLAVVPSAEPAPPEPVFEPAPPESALAEPAPPRPEFPPASRANAEKSEIFPEEPGAEAWSWRVGQVLTLRGVSRVVVGDPSVLGVAKLEDGSGVVVTALRPGASDLAYREAQAPAESPDKSVRVAVRTHRADAVQRELEALLAYIPGVRVERAGGGSLAVTGAVLERSDRQKLNKVLAAFGASSRASSPESPAGAVLEPQKLREGAADSLGGRR